MLDKSFSSFVNPTDINDLLKGQSYRNASNLSWDKPVHKPFISGYLACITLKKKAFPMKKNRSERAVFSSSA
jgi:hypothetical protein